MKKNSGEGCGVETLCFAVSRFCLFHTLDMDNIRYASNLSDIWNLQY